MREHRLLQAPLTQITTTICTPQQLTTHPDSTKQTKPATVAVTTYAPSYQIILKGEMPVTRQSREERRGHAVLCPPFSRLLRLGSAILVHSSTDVARVGHRGILHGTRLQRRKRAKNHPRQGNRCCVHYKHRL